MKFKKILLKLVKFLGLAPTIADADSLDGNVHTPFVQSTGEATTTEKRSGVEV